MAPMSFNRQPSHLSFVAFNLRRVRLNRRFTQAEVAARAGRGITQQDISAFERGIPPSDSSQIAALARALRVSSRTLRAKPSQVNA